MHIPFLIYLALCFAVALLGVGRKMGFYGYFFASLLLTPIVGGLLVLISGPAAEKKT
jgi:Na+/glutamate symporter